MKIYYRIKNAVKANQALYPLFCRARYLKDRLVHAEEYKALQTDGLRVMSLIQSTLEGSAEFHFCAGTLLGMIRENRFLKHDNDIDVTVHAETQTEVGRIEKLFTDAGCKRVHSYWIDGIGTVEDAFSVYGFRFDVFYYFHGEKIDYSYTMYTEPELAGDKEFRNVLQMCFSPFGGEKQIDFYGQKFNVPSEPERTLEEGYGVNWRIPDKYFCYWNAPNAVKTSLIARKKVY